MVTFDCAMCMVCVNSCKNQDCITLKAIYKALEICDRDIFLAANFSETELETAIQIQKTKVEDMSYLVEEITKK